MSNHQSEKFATISTGALERPPKVSGHLRLFLRNLILDIESSLFTKQSDTCVRCLYCHYVFDDQVEVFENILRELSSFANFITSETLLQFLKGKRNLSGINFHLSFDDGLKNNYLNAAPILEKLDIPGTFFIPTQYIDADYHTVSDYCLNKAKYSKVIELMGSSDILDLSNRGFEIGSHSHSHPRLSELPHKDLYNEIFLSKSILENLLQKDCNLFSWPYGTLNDINDEVAIATEKAGYELIFGGFRGSVSSRTNPNFVPRHHFEPQWKLNHVKYFLRGNRETALS